MYEVYVYRYDGEVLYVGEDYKLILNIIKKENNRLQGMIEDVRAKKLLH